MQKHLLAATYADGFAAMRIMQMREDTFNASPDSVSNVLCRKDVYGTRSDAVSLDRLDFRSDMSDFVLARIGLDQRLVPKRQGFFKDIICIVGRIGKIVKVREGLACFLHQRDGDLRIM